MAENSASELFDVDRSVKKVSDEMLTEEQRELLNEIREKFKPDEIVADLCILYEITNYKDESAEPDFWDM